MGLPNCEAIWFAEMELVRKGRRGKRMGKILSKELVSCYVSGCRVSAKTMPWTAESNMNMRSWTVELKEELYNMELAFVWRKKQECILREITNLLKDRCNNIKRHNTCIVA